MVCPDPDPLHPKAFPNDLTVVRSLVQTVHMTTTTTTATTYHLRNFAPRAATVIKHAAKLGAIVLISTENEDTSTASITFHGNDNFMTITSTRIDNGERVSYKMNGSHTTPWNANFNKHTWRDGTWAGFAKSLCGDLDKLV